MFSGGFETSWKEARYVAKEAILLSSFGVVLTSLFVAKGKKRDARHEGFSGRESLLFSVSGMYLL